MIWLVVDASVATKWYFQEANSDKALEIQSWGVFLAAPDLFVVEMANVLWKLVGRRHTTPEKAAGALCDVQEQVHLFRHLRNVQRALEIAHFLNHPVYDCLYIALAEQLNARFVTADERLVRTLKKSAWHDMLLLLPS